MKKTHFSGCQTWQPG